MIVETSSGGPEGTERVAGVRRALSMDGTEGAMEGTTEKGAFKAEGRCFNFLLMVHKQPISCELFECCNGKPQQIEVYGEHQVA